MKRRHAISGAMTGVALLITLSLLGLSACAKHKQTPVNGAQVGEPTPTVKYIQPYQAGINILDDGRVVAMGTARYVDLEGGFWVLTKPAAPGSPRTEDVVVVVVNAKEVGLPAHDGQTVQVNGTLIKGASIRMAGPEMTAEEVLVPH